MIVAGKPQLWLAPQPQAVACALHPRQCRPHGLAAPKLPGQTRGAARCRTVLQAVEAPAAAQPQASNGASLSPEDLPVGTQIQGKVVNVKQYGGFVDIGTPKPALLHAKEINNDFVSDAATVLSVGDMLDVWVIRNDAKGIGLSCKPPGSSPRKGGSSPSSKMPALDLEAVSNGDTVDGIVAKIEDYGVFVDIGASGYGLLHRSQTKGPLEFQLGDTIQTRLLEKDRTDDKGRRKIALTQLQPGEKGSPGGQRMSSAPARNPRQKFDVPDLVRGMRVTGSVRGVRDFGAFVDFGGPRDGLLHTLRYKKDRYEIGEEISELYITDIDAGDGSPQALRIKLSAMEPTEADLSGESRPRTRNERPPRGPPLSEQFTVGQSLEGEVTDVRVYGVILKMGESTTTLLHRNQMADVGDDRADPQSFSLGQKLTVRVDGVDDRARKLQITQRPEEESSGSSGPSRSNGNPDKWVGFSPGDQEGKEVSLEEAGTSTASEELSDEAAPLAQSSQPSGTARAAGATKAKPSVSSSPMGGGAFGVAFNKAGLKPKPAETPKEQAPASPGPESVLKAEDPAPATSAAPEEVAEVVPEASQGTDDGEPSIIREPAEVAEEVVESLEPDMTQEPVSQAPGPDGTSAVEQTIDLPHEHTPVFEAASDVPQEKLEEATQEPAAAASGSFPRVAADGSTSKADEPGAQPAAAGDAELFTSEEAMAAAQDLMGLDAQEDSPAVEATVDIQSNAQPADMPQAEPQPEAAAIPEAAEPEGEASPPVLEASSPAAEAPASVEEPAAVTSPRELEAQAEATPDAAIPSEAPPPREPAAGEASEPAEPAAPLEEVPQPATAAAAEAAQPAEAAQLEEASPLPAQQPELHEAVTPPATAAAQEEQQAPPQDTKQSVSALTGKPREASATPSDGPKIDPKLVQQLRRESGAGMMQCKKALAESEGDLKKATEYLRIKGLATASKKQGRTASEGVIASYVHTGNRVGVIMEVNCETDFVARSDDFCDLVELLCMQLTVFPDLRFISATQVDPAFIEAETRIEMGKEDIQSKPEKFRPQIVKGRVEKTVRQMCLLEAPFVKGVERTVDEVIAATTAKLGEKISVRRFVRYSLGEGVEKKKEANLGAEVEEQKKALAAKAEAAKAEAATQEQPQAAAEPAAAAIKVDPKAVQALRKESGAGMMDCKKALSASGGDHQQATEWLRKKGLAGADKKAGRAAAEGAIFSYIHTGDKLGVLLEVNCETDFAARSDRFLELAEDLSMQIAACDCTVLMQEDIDPALLQKEKEIELQKEDLASKPEQIRLKMVEGRVAKLAKSMALLEAPYVKDTNKSVGQHIKEEIAVIGENIQIRRFERFQLGEEMAELASAVAEEETST